MNENIYKLEIKVDEIKEKLVDTNVLIIVDKVTFDKYKINFKKLFVKHTMLNIMDEEAIDKEIENLHKYDLIFSVPFSDNGKLITKRIKIENNTKHIILLNDKVTQYDILSLNKAGNVLFLGNNMEVYENIEILYGYVKIILNQKKFKELSSNIKKETNVNRDMYLIYSDVIVVQNILKKALDSVYVKQNKCAYEKEAKGFYQNLQKNADKIKVIILTSENPPFEEVKMINKISQDIIILYVTSTKDPTLLNELNRLGVDDYIYKPFEFENLIEKLKQANGNDLKTDSKISLFSLKELIETFNSFTLKNKMSDESKSLFKEYFKYLQH
jgi:response regulator of citrate/malate metabolism